MTDEIASEISEAVQAMAEGTLSHNTDLCTISIKRSKGGAIFVGLSEQ